MRPSGRRHRAAATGAPLAGPRGHPPPISPAKQHAAACPGAPARSLAATPAQGDGAAAGKRDVTNQGSGSKLVEVVAPGAPTMSTSTAATESAAPAGRQVAGAAVAVSQQEDARRNSRREPAGVGSVCGLVLTDAAGFGQQAPVPSSPPPAANVELPAAAHSGGVAAGDPRASPEASISAPPPPAAGSGASNGASLPRMDSGCQVRGGTGSTSAMSLFRLDPMYQHPKARWRGRGQEPPGSPASRTTGPRSPASTSSGSRMDVEAVTGPDAVSALAAGMAAQGIDDAPATSASQDAAAAFASLSVSDDDSGRAGARGARKAPIDARPSVRRSERLRAASQRPRQ